MRTKTLKNICDRPTDHKQRLLTSAMEFHHARVIMTKFKRVALFPFHCQVSGRLRELTFMILFGYLWKSLSVIVLFNYVPIINKTN